MKTIKTDLRYVPLMPHLLVAVACATSSWAQEPKEVFEIPLSEVRALDMPHTLPLSPRGATDETVAASLRGLLAYLSEGAPAKETASPAAFTVTGDYEQALESVASVLLAGGPREKVVTQEDRVWIAFYCYESTELLHLNTIHRRGDQIDIRYRIIPKLERSAPVQLALIPLPTLPGGDYRVTVVRESLDRDTAMSRYETLAVDSKFRELPFGAESRFVSGSFCFSVQTVATKMPIN
ncbi:hypothetical protein MalM25_09260 [Planctomycetes bacterium MalM25]|nr:hypothetical protein MalM25_09260 [Planctomycetes bacterium MalM25]